MSFEHLPKGWQTRLVVMRDVFPWITPAIKEIAGLAPSDDLSSPQSAIAFIAAHSDYTLGTRSNDPKVHELHHRQNREWEQIIGTGPLSTPADWRAAGHAANAPDDAIIRCDVELLARFITPWAIAKRLAAIAESPAVTGNRRRVSMVQGGIQIDEIVVALKEKQASLMRLLVDAGGEYVALDAHGYRSRDIEALPPAIQAIVDAQPGAGTRILPQWLN